MKILSIDIGSASIKSVIVEAKFKRFDVISYDITPVSDAWSPLLPEQSLTQGQLDALMNVRSKFAYGMDRIVTNLPLSLYSSRFQSFPIKDKRKVQAAVKFAIEDEIPFDVDDCIVTSHLYPTAPKVKETHVITGYAQIKSLEEFITNVGLIQLQVDCLMMEEAALASQFLRSKTERPKNCAVLNLGHRKSTMYFFRDSLPVLHRTAMVGGYQITQDLAAKYSIGLEEAEAAKVERAFLSVPGMQLSSDQMVFTQTIQASLEPVLADFQQSLMAFTSRHNESLDTIYLCGGTSLIPGLPEFLSHRWHKKVLPLQVPRLHPQISMADEKVQALMPVATALGISQVSGESKSQINFRSGKLHSTARGLKLNFKQFVYPAKLAVTVYLVAMFSLMGQLFFLNRELSKKDELFSRALQSVLGRVSASFLNSLKTSETKLKQSINKELEKYQTGGQTATANSSLDLILELSKAVPKTSVMEIKQLDFQQNQITLQVDSPTQADAEKALASLKIPRLLNPKAGPIENGKGTRKKFTLSAGLAKRG